MDTNEAKEFKKSAELMSLSVTRQRLSIVSFSALGALGLSAALGTTAPGILIPIIAKSLKLSSTQSFWIGTASGLTATVIQPCCACFAEVLGRRSLLILSAVALSLGNLFATLGYNFALLLTGRCLQGLGLGSSITIVDIIACDLVPIQHRGKWLSLCSAPIAIGTILGPLLAGALGTEHLWHYVFVVNVPIPIVAIIVAAYTLPTLPGPHMTWDDLRRIDFIGILVLSTSMIGLLIPILQAGSVYTWTNAHTLVPLCLSITGLLGFILWEVNRGSSALIPLTAFYDRTCIIGLILTCIHGFVVYCLLYYLPLYYEGLKGFRTILTGVALLPETLTTVPASVLVGFVASRTRRYRWSIWAGWLFLLIGIPLLCLLEKSTTTPAIVGLNLLPGIGIGFLFGGLGFTVQSTMTDARVSTGVAVFTTCRSFGSTMGIAVGGSIFQTTFKHHLQESSAAVLGSDVPSSSRNPLQLLSLLRAGPQAPLLDNAWRQALRNIWTTAAVASAVALILSLFLASDLLKLDTDRFVRGKVEDLEADDKSNITSANA